MSGRQRGLAVGLVGLLILTTSCASSKASATEPQLASATRVGGRGYPFGASDAGAWQPLTKAAASSDYGYTEAHPIQCGGGPAGERQYLNSLRGPQGQVLQYERAGSCCHFAIPDSEVGGMLDVYDVTWEGAAKPLQLYLNMYETGEMLVPVGLTARK